MLPVVTLLSASDGPTIVDVRALSKWVRSIRAEPCALRRWPLKGSLRLVGYPDAAYRNNVDNSSQRGQAIFLAEERSTSKYGFIRNRGRVSALFWSFDWQKT